MMARWLSWGYLHLLLVQLPLALAFFRRHAPLHNVPRLIPRNTNGLPDANSAPIFPSGTGSLRYNSSGIWHNGSTTTSHLSQSSTQSTTSEATTTSVAPSTKVEHEAKGSPVDGEFSFNLNVTSSHNASLALNSSGPENFPERLPVIDTNTRRRIDSGISLGDGAVPVTEAPSDITTTPPYPTATSNQSLPDTYNTGSTTSSASANAGRFRADFWLGAGSSSRSNGSVAPEDGSNPSVEVDEPKPPPTDGSASVSGRFPPHSINHTVSFSSQATKGPWHHFPFSNTGPKSTPAPTPTSWNLTDGINSTGTALASTSSNSTDGMNSTDTASQSTGTGSNSDLSDFFRLRTNLNGSVGQQLNGPSNITRTGIERLNLGDNSTNTTGEGQLGSFFMGKSWNDTESGVVGNSSGIADHVGQVQILPKGWVVRLQSDNCSGTRTNGEVQTVYQTEIEYVDALNYQNTTSAPPPQPSPPCYEFVPTDRGKDPNYRFNAIPDVTTTSTLLVQKLRTAGAADDAVNRLFAGPAVQAQPVMNEPTTIAAQKSSATSNGDDRPPPIFTQNNIPAATQTPSNNGGSPGDRVRIGDTSGSDHGSEVQPHDETKPSSTSQLEPLGNGDAQTQGSPTQDGNPSTTNDASPATFAAHYFQPSVNQPSNNQPTDLEPTNNQPTNNQPSNNQQENSRPSNNQPSNNQPSEDQPSNNQPSNNQPSNNQPSNSQASNNQPSDTRPADDQPVSGGQAGSSDFRNTFFEPNSKSGGTGVSSDESKPSDGPNNQRPSNGGQLSVSTESTAGGQGNGATGGQFRNTFFGGQSRNDGNGANTGSSGDSGSSGNAGLPGTLDNQGSSNAGGLSSSSTGSDTGVSVATHGAGSGGESSHQNPGSGVQSQPSNDGNSGNGGSRPNSQASPADSGQDFKNTFLGGSSSGSQGADTQSSDAGKGSAQLSGPGGSQTMATNAGQDTSPSKEFSNSFFGGSKGSGSPVQGIEDAKGSQVQPIFPLPGAQPSNNPTVSTTVGGIPVKLDSQNVVIGTQTFNRGSSPTSEVVNGQTFKWNGNTFEGPSGNIQFPAANANAPSVIVGGEEFTVNPSHVDFAGKTIPRPKDPKPSPFEANGQLFYINPSQVISPETDIPFSPSPSTTPKAKAYPFIYNGDTLSADHSYLIAGPTSMQIPDSGIVDYKGKKLDIKSDRIIAPDTTIPFTLPAVQTFSPATVGSLTFSIRPAGAKIGNIEIDNIQTNMAPITTTVSGQRIEVGPSGIKIGNSPLVPLPTTPPTRDGSSSNNIQGQPFRVYNAGHFDVAVADSTAIIDGHTFTAPPGSPTTSTVIGNRVLRIGPSGVHFDGTTVDLPTSTPETTAQAIAVGANQATIGGKTYPVGPGAPTQKIQLGNVTVTVGPEGVIIPAITLGNGVVVSASTIRPSGSGAVAPTSTAAGGFTTKTTDAAGPGVGSVEAYRPPGSTGSVSPLSPSSGGQRTWGRVVVWRIYPIFMVVMTFLLF